MTRRHFLQFGGLGAAGALAGYSLAWERHRLQTTERTIHLERLAPDLDGLRIAQISDIHFEQFTEAWFVRDVVAEVNRQAPDVVVLTGDYISQGPLPMRYGAKSSYPCAEILSGIRCPQRWAVLGNHDTRVNPAMVTDALETHGIPVLANRHVPIERNGARLWLAGVEDVGLGHPDLDLAAPRGLQSAREPVILLAHEPDYARKVMRHGGVDLMLAGHTHGGQVRMPGIGPLYLPPWGKHFPEGLFHLDNGVQLYVNRGVGTVGIPVRFDCRPELTMITLRSGRNI